MTPQRSTRCLSLLALALPLRAESYQAQVEGHFSAVRSLQRRQPGRSRAVSWWSSRAWGHAPHLEAYERFLPVLLSWLIPNG